MPGFNVGEGLVEDDHLYLTAFGFVGKLNVLTCQYAWRHTNLYDEGRDLYGDGRFNSFKRPIVGSTR